MKYKIDMSKRKKSFKYDSITGIFKGQGLCFLDPMESANAGKDIFALPPNMTIKEPPKVKKDQVAVFDTENKVWNVKDYWNNKHFYKKDTGNIVSLTGFKAELNESLTRLKPPSEYHVWNESLSDWQYEKSGDHCNKIELEIDFIMKQKSKENFTWENASFGSEKWSVQSLENVSYRDTGLYALLCKAGREPGEGWIEFDLISVNGHVETFTAEAFLDLVKTLTRRNMELFNKAQAMKQALYEIRNDDGTNPIDKFEVIKNFEIDFNEK